MTVFPIDGSRLRRLVFGSRDRIAGTVYGTIVVMATLTAGSGAAHEPWQLATIILTTVAVLWIAHVYAHALEQSIAAGHAFDRRELAALARHELAIPLAAVAPVIALVLGEIGILRESRAIWLAIGFGLATLAVQGLRYAHVERLGRSGTALAVTLNLLLGLVIVMLKASVAH